MEKWKYRLTIQAFTRMLRQGIDYAEKHFIFFIIFFFQLMKYFIDETSYDPMLIEETELYLTHSGAADDEPIEEWGKNLALISY